MMQEAITKQHSKLSQHALQAQMQVYNLQEWLMVGSAIAVAGGLRIAMQGLPNIEPLTVIAILSGALFGKWKGAMVGASSVWWSNFFVIGGQGPWSLFQVIAFGTVGLLAGFLPKKIKVWHAFSWALLSTVIFEIVMNVSWAALFRINPLYIFMTGLPFFVTHLWTNLAFSSSIPYLKRKFYEMGKFEDRELCRALLARFNTSARVPGK